MKKQEGPIGTFDVQNRYWFDSRLFCERHGTGRLMTFKEAVICANGYLNARGVWLSHKDGWRYVPRWRLRKIRLVEMP